MRHRRDITGGAEKTYAVTILMANFRPEKFNLKSEKRQGGTNSGWTGIVEVRIPASDSLQGEAFADGIPATPTQAGPLLAR